MSLFTFDYRESGIKNLEPKDDYALISYEFNKVANIYHVKQELYSDKFWKYLEKEFDIKNENLISTRTEIEVDERNRIHKIYKYYVKCFINKKDFIIITFLDEDRNLSDDDYHEYTSDDDKSNKISEVVIYYDSDKINTKKLEDAIVTKMLKDVYLPSMKNQFFTISTSQFGGYTLKVSYIKESTIDLALNYGEKFPDIYEKIIHHLKNKKHGLFLFHGEPGTGKTFFIRKLICELSEKKTFIYVPTYMMHSIADPEFISFLSGFKDAILILEDAENILTQSFEQRTQAVANILNMTDGLLNDYLNIQIISTFNVPTKMIDSALTRAGRLIVNYKFSKLNIKNANKLAETLKMKEKFSESKSLAEIYEGANQIVEDDDLNKQTPIGFKVNK